MAVTYVSKLGEKTISINEDYQKTASSYIPNYQNIPLKELSPIDEKFKGKGADLFSPVFQSTISNNPVILLKHYILNKEGVIKCALFTEISTKYITDMCSKISFGDKGHCAIVDQTGHVVAHPNKDWEKEIRDLSKLHIIQKMLDGKVGTTEFYSPFLKADMVAGFSAIPNLGWGIMIPQPKIELTRSLGTIRKNTLIWLSLGILVALGVAYLLTQKITNPIKILMKRAHDASAGYDFIQLGSIPKNSPKEINQLWDSISLLLTSLQNSNRKVKKLNVSLSRDINKATKNLRSMNKHLYDVSSKDYLTSLANRRFFNNYINRVIEKNKNIGLILIDIDNFKSINDLHGHEIGDLALKHISMILQKSTRKGDLVSRLGGDEFIVYVNNSSEKTIAAVAENIRLITEVNPIKVKGITINLSLSIGTVIYKAGSEAPTLEELLRLADGAMYSSKQSGRNKVTSCKFYPTTELTA